MKQKLIKVIDDIVDLLKECNWHSKASWFEGELDIIKRSNEDADEFFSSINTLKNILAGMGSFTDLPLTPREGSKLSKNEARKKQFFS